MAEMNVKRDSGRLFKARHRGRIGQIGIYFARQLVMFVYQSDWKVLPMAALIAGLVGMVIRNRLFLNMEGTLMGSFAMVCVCIWNGCFNSIQVICRERDVIKREHRSGMHISSYIVSHMMYQALLCLMQTAVTLYVTKAVGVKYPAEGLFTPWMILDFGISMFLIAYASDMLSLWVSCLSRSTTTAMTIMPFVLIFQLVFSGGMLSLPAWTEPLTHFTISNPGLKVIAAQADTNNRPFVTISNMLAGMRDSEISGEITLGRVLEILTDADNPAVEQVRSIEMGGSFSGADLHDALYTSQTVLSHREDKLIDELTLGDVMDMLEAAELWGEIADVSIDARATVGEIIDLLAANPDVQAHSGDSFRFSATVGGLIDIVGEDNVKTFVEEKAAAASYKAEYALTKENVTQYWLHLLAFIVAFALLATVTLEFIDRDKR